MSWLWWTETMKHYSEIKRVLSYEEWKAERSLESSWEKKDSRRKIPWTSEFEMMKEYLEYCNTTSKENAKVSEIETYTRRTIDWINLNLELFTNEEIVRKWLETWLIIQWQSAKDVAKIYKKIDISVWKALEVIVEQNTWMKRWKWKKAYKIWTINDKFIANPEQFLKEIKLFVKNQTTWTEKIRIKVSTNFVDPWEFTAKQSKSSIINLLSADLSNPTEIIKILGPKLKNIQNKDDLNTALQKLLWRNTLNNIQKGNPQLLEQLLEHSNMKEKK